MWKAYFSDGSVLSEFIKGKEIPFKKVLDRLQDLENLSIIENGKEFTVSLTTGMFTIKENNEDPVSFYVLKREDIINLENIRPIYFIRDRIDFKVGNNMEQVGSYTVFTALGFQAILNGKNIKRYLEIPPKGPFVLRDE